MLIINVDFSLCVSIFLEKHKFRKIFGTNQQSLKVAMLKHLSKLDGARFKYS
jgi:hypothetical protein